MVVGLVGAGITSYGFLGNHGQNPAKNSYKTAVLSAQTTQYQIKVNKITVGDVLPVTKTKRVTLSTTIKNLTSGVFQVSPGLQMFLIGQNGANYNMTAKFLPSQAVVGGPLAGQTSRTEDIDFEIPATATPKKFTFQLDGSSPITSLGL